MLLSDKYCTFSVRIVCSLRSVITSLRATCNTARRFNHAPVCPRLGHPPPSCSATPGSVTLPNTACTGCQLPAAKFVTIQYNNFYSGIKFKDAEVLCG